MDEIRKPIELDASGKPTKAWLEYMYTEQHLSHKVIARIVERGSATIHKLLKRYEIPLRGPKPPLDRAVLEGLIHEGLTPDKIAERLDVTYGKAYHFLLKYGLWDKSPIHPVKPTREWLVQKHFIEKMTWREIRQLLGYGDGNFHELLKKYDIPRKQYVPVREVVSKDDLYQMHVVEGHTAVAIAAKIECSPSSIQRLINKYQLDPGRQLINLPREIPVSSEELERLYVQEKLSCVSIGKLYGVNGKTIGRWLRQYTIPVRQTTLPKEPVNRVYVRKSTPTTRYAKNFTAQERECILKRDGYRCQMPDCTCTDRWKLEVHHILPVEHDGTNAFENGITLCRECHISIKNRELHYIALFQRIVNITLSGVQTGYIGETPENQDNPEGSLVEEVCSTDEQRQTP